MRQSSATCKPRKMKSHKSKSENLLKLFPTSESIIPCKNSQFGCSKAGKAAKLFLHQSICTYNPYTSSYNRESFVRTLKTKGYLCRKLSYNSENETKFVSFNNSFLKDLGLQFFFKDGLDRIEIQAFSSVPIFQDISFILAFKTDISFTIKGKLNRIHRFPLTDNVKKESIIKYKITVSFKDAPIVIE
jgi:hypothetical protein